MSLIRKIKSTFYDFKYRTVSVKKLRSDFNRYIEQTSSVTLKKGGVYKNQAITEEIILEINDENKIETFKSLFKIEIPTSWEACLCAGDYAIELYDSQKRKLTTIGLHHNYSIRLNEIIGDAILTTPTEFIDFLKELGLHENVQTEN